MIVAPFIHVAWTSDVDVSQQKATQQKATWWQYET